jgi:hypothetical protein
MKSEKQILAERALIRAQSGLYFLEDIMRHVNGGTDGAYSRSRYILLAYNFELILNSLFILASQKSNRGDIIKDLIFAAKKHDFASLFNQIPISSRLGILKIEKDERSGFIEYHVELDNNKKIMIQDLIDVRYDFKKDNLRKINFNEAAEIKEAIDSLIEITKNIINKYSLLGVKN